MKFKINIFLISVLFLWGCSNEIERIPYVPSEPTLLIPPSGFVPCEGGQAGVYPCSGYDLQAVVSLGTFEAESGNDSWGWTDPLTGKEYVLMGLDNGTAFVDVTTPDQPIYLGKLSTATNPSTWRDIKVYRNHAFIVSEAANHGMQVFDLTRLRAVPSKQNFTADARFTGFGNAHNIAINESTGIAYVIGSSLYEGGPAFIDINDPLNPTLVGGFSEESYTHDAHIVTYNGPDLDYTGREILFGSNSDGGDNNQVVIVDVTDKSNPTLISNMTYSNGGYTHQGWLAQDHRFYYLGDELDEINFGGQTKTLVFDLEDLDNPVLHHTYLGPTQAIDHNVYSKNNSLFISNYTAGFREANIQNVANGAMEEIGFFDSYPSNNGVNFNGVWNVYPFFESGVIVISDINSGLFLVKASE